MAPGAQTRDAATQLRDVEALRLRAQGKTLEQIAAAVGWANKSTAKRAVDRLLAEVKFTAVDEYRQLQLARLEAAVAKVTEILYGDHPYVSEGRVLKGVRDVGPNLRAAGELRQLEARIAALLGTDAPTRRIVEVLTEDVIDAAIREELAAMEALDAADSAAGRSGSVGEAAAPA